MGPTKNHADPEVRVRYAYGDARRDCQENGRYRHTSIGGRCDILIVLQGGKHTDQKLASSARCTQGMAAALTVGGSCDSRASATFINAAS